MYLTGHRKDEMYKLAHEKVRGSKVVKLFLRNPALREWVVKNTCEAITAELSLYNEQLSFGAIDQGELEARIIKRVEKANLISRGDGTYGFAIWPIILASIISWLIKELLDWLSHG